MHSWQQSQKHKAPDAGRDARGAPIHPSIHPSIHLPYKLAIAYRRGDERRRRIAHSCAAPVFLCACDACQQRAVHEGPPWQLRRRRRRPLRRLPLLHGLHVAVRRVRRRPQREEGAGGPLLLVVLCCRRRHDRQHGGSGSISRFIRRRRREGGGGDAGARGDRGVEADEGDPEPVAHVRGVRRRRGGGRGAGDGDRVPHGRAARGPHRLGRPQQHGWRRRRRHGEHGERLLAALLPLPPPPRHGHGPRRRARLRLNLTSAQLRRRLPGAAAAAAVASRICH